MACAGVEVLDQRFGRHWSAYACCCLHDLSGKSIDGPYAAAAGP